MDTLILSIIDSIREECFTAALKYYKYSDQRCSESFESEPSIKQAEESIILKHFDDTTQLTRPTNPRNIYSIYVYRI